MLNHEQKYKEANDLLNQSKKQRNLAKKILLSLNEYAPAQFLLAVLIKGVKTSCFILILGVDINVCQPPKKIAHVRICLLFFSALFMTSQPLYFKVYVFVLSFIITSNAKI